MLNDHQQHESQIIMKEENEKCNPKGFFVFLLKKKIKRTETLTLVNVL